MFYLWIYIYNGNLVDLSWKIPGLKKWPFPITLLTWQETDEYMTDQHMWPEALVSNQVHLPMYLRSQKDFVITGEGYIFPISVWKFKKKKKIQQSDVTNWSSSWSADGEKNHYICSAASWQ